MSDKDYLLMIVFAKNDYRKDSCISRIPNIQAWFQKKKELQKAHM